jgi:polyisoprenoid-binding protein YceI
LWGTAALGQGLVGAEYAPKLFDKVPFHLTIQPGSSISYYAQATFHWFTGTSQRAEGEFFADGKGPLAGRTNRLTVPVASLRTGINARDALMIELLRADIHPNVIFDVKRFDVVERTGGINEFRLKVTGDLTIRGVTRSETADVWLKVYDDNVTITGQTDLYLSRYSIDPPTFLWFLKMRDRLTVKWSFQGEVEFLFAPKTTEAGG